MIGDNALQRIFAILQVVDRRLGNVEALLAEVSRSYFMPEITKRMVHDHRAGRSCWGKSDFTIREKWCNQGRIACEKDPDSGKVANSRPTRSSACNGGGLKPRQPR